jgi:hypothetical protein
MLIFFDTEKSIRMRDLFDGRLEAHGVQEMIRPDTSEKTRYLIDREGNDLMARGNDNGVEFCLGRGPQTGTAILDIIRRVFTTRIFDGNRWIAVFRPTRPTSLADMIDGRLERDCIAVKEVRRRPDGTPKSASLSDNQGRLLWVHAGDDGMVEYAEGHEDPAENCLVFFINDIENVFGHEFALEREENSAWSTSPLNKYGTRWSDDPEPETPEELAEAAEIDAALQSLDKLPTADPNVTSPLNKYGTMWSDDPEPETPEELAEAAETDAALQLLDKPPTADANVMSFHLRHFEFFKSCVELD